MTTDPPTRLGRVWNKLAKTNVDVSCDRAKEILSQLTDADVARDLVRITFEACRRAPTFALLVAKVMREVTTTMNVPMADHVVRAIDDELYRLVRDADTDTNTDADKKAPVAFAVAVSSDDACAARRWRTVVDSVERDVSPNVQAALASSMVLSPDLWHDVTRPNLMRLNDRFGKAVGSQLRFEMARIAEPQTDCNTWCSRLNKSFAIPDDAVPDDASSLSRRATL